MVKSGHLIMGFAVFTALFGMFYAVPTFAQIPFVKQFYFISETFNKTEVLGLINGTQGNASNGTVKNIFEGQCIDNMPNTITVNGTVNVNVTCLNQNYFYYKNQTYNISQIENNYTVINNSVNNFIISVNTSMQNFLISNNISVNNYINSTFYNKTTSDSRYFIGDNLLNYKNISLALNTNRTPNSTRPVFVIATVNVSNSNILSGAAGLVFAVVNNTNITSNGQGFGLLGPGSLGGFNSQVTSMSFIVPPNITYQLQTMTEMGTPTFQIVQISEMTL